MCGKTKQQQYVDIAKQMARKSCLTHKHGVVIVHKNKVIATGYNRFDCIHKGSNGQFSLHAEVDALNKARKKYRDVLTEADMYVVRVSNDKFKCSKPCRMCENCIKEYGIRRVFYS
jgi:pyrimidine deaminase RibD-like protein